MITENEMIHGTLPRLGASQKRRSGFPRRFGRSRELPHAPPWSGRPGMGEWDVSALDYEGMRRHCEEAANPYRLPCPTRIEQETSIVPHAIAKHVCDETALWLGQPFPRGWAEELAERANVIYQHSGRFRRLLRQSAGLGRDWLQAFMRHWLAALLNSRRPDLASRLPASFAAGYALSPPPASAASSILGTSLTAAEAQGHEGQAV